MNKLSLAASIAMVLLLGSTAWALDCPVVDNGASATTVAGNLPADIDLDAPDALQSAVFDLRSAGIADDLILDNLIAVYCTAVSAEAGTSDDDKTERIKAFSQTATQAVFGDVN